METPIQTRAGKILSALPVLFLLFDSAIKLIVIRPVVDSFAQLGWPIRLVDTAGLWDAPERVDQLGVEVSRRYLAAADLVLLCVETGRPPGPDEEAIAGERPTLILRTKADLDGGGSHGNGSGLRVSTVTGQGLAELRRSAAERVFSDRIGLADLEPALGRARHRTALTRAREALSGALDQLATDPVLTAHHLREATAALDELIGAVDVEEVLGRVFEGFCVGK